MTISRLLEKCTQLKSEISTLEDFILDYKREWENRLKHLEGLADMVRDDDTYIECCSCKTWVKVGEDLADEDNNPVCEQCAR